MSLLLNHYSTVSHVCMQIANHNVYVPQSSTAVSSVNAKIYRSLSSRTIASTLRHPVRGSGNHSYCVYVKDGPKFKNLGEQGSTQRISSMLILYLDCSRAQAVFVVIHTTVRSASDFWPLDVFLRNVFSAVRRLGCHTRHIFVLFIDENLMSSSGYTDENAGS